MNRIDSDKGDRDGAWQHPPMMKCATRGEALELAQKLNQLQGEKSPVALDTLAAAHAEAGNFNEALRISEKALDMARQAKNEKLAEEIEWRQRLYQAGKPFRQSFSPAES